MKFILELISYAIAIWWFVHWVKRFKLRYFGSTCMGTVTRVKVKDGFNYFIVCYRNNDGEAFEVSSQWGSEDSRFKVGDEVEVHYQKKSPEQGVIHDADELWLPFVGFAIIFFGLRVVITQLA